MIVNPRRSSDSLIENMPENLLAYAIHQYRTRRGMIVHYTDGCSRAFWHLRRTYIGEIGRTRPFYLTHNEYLPLLERELVLEQEQHWKESMPDINITV